MAKRVVQRVVVITMLIVVEIIIEIVIAIRVVRIVLISSVFLLHQCITYRNLESTLQFVSP